MQKNELPTLMEVIDKLVDKGAYSFANELNLIVCGNPIVIPKKESEQNQRLAYIYPKNVELPKDSQKRLLTLMLGSFQKHYDWIPGKKAIIEVDLNQKLKVCTLPIPLDKYLTSDLNQYIDKSSTLAVYTRKLYKRKGKEI